MDFHKLTRYVNPKRVLDIGAHVGNFTTTLNRLTPGCEFIMVEANPNCEEYLVKTTHPYEIIALSNQQGKAQLYVEKANSIGTVHRYIARILNGMVMENTRLLK
jgi:FkbM family methyltransferase